MADLDRGLVASALVAARENVPAVLREEIVKYVQTVLEARTATDARKLAKPEALRPAAKSRPLTELQRAARAATARLLYLSALDTGTANMSTKALSRVKSQSWKSWEHFDVGIALPVRCHACSQMASLMLRNLHESTAYRFQCQGCGHQYRGGKNQSETGADCACSLCTEHKNKLLHEIVEIIESSGDSMVHRHSAWLAGASGQLADWPSELEMERAYKLNKDNLGKDLRAILSLRPKDAEDFRRCLDHFLESHSGKRVDIVDKAITTKVLYRRQIPDALIAARPIDLLLKAGAEACCTVIGERSFGGGRLGLEAATVIIHKMLAREIPASELFIDSDGITVRQNIRTNQWDGVATVRLIEAASRRRDGLLDCEMVRQWRTEEKLNPYFTGAVKSVEYLAEQLAKNAQPLFNSRTEGQAYLRIVDENRDCIVVPNRLLKRIADIGQLRRFLDKQEFDYAKDAEIDFAVYSSDGQLLFVEELQRGDHHNQPEWIWKDGVKRKVLELAGIPFRESF